MKFYLPKTPEFVYTLKCLTGLSACYALYIRFPQFPFYWSMVSVLLSFAPLDAQGNKLAFDRIKANVAGSIIGVGIFLIHPPGLLLLCLGVVIVIVVGTIFKFENATRSALAAVIIVTMYERKESSWHIAFERMFCVITGCAIALVITELFSFSATLLRKYKKGPSRLPDRQAENGKK